MKTKLTPKTIIVWCSGWKLSIPFPVAQSLKLSDGQQITPELAATITTGQIELVTA